MGRMAEKQLTAKQQAFVQAYLTNGRNAAAAYRAAYKADRMSPAAVRVEASRLLARPNVALMVRAVAEAASEKAAVDTAWVLRRLVDNVERASQALPVTDRDGKPTGEYRYDGGVVNKGL